MIRSPLAYVSATARACADWWAREGGPRLGSPSGDASVGQRLLELGLDVRRLSPRSRARLRLDTARVPARRPETCSQHQVALQFFAWYVMSAPDSSPTALREGAVSNALTVIRAWCEIDPGLVKTAAPHFHRLSAHLYQMHEAPVTRLTDGPRLAASSRQPAGGASLNLSSDQRRL